MFARTTFASIVRSPLLRASTRRSLDEALVAHPLACEALAASCDSCLPLLNLQVRVTFLLVCVRALTTVGEERMALRPPGLRAKTRNIVSISVLGIVLANAATLSDDDVVDLQLFASWPSCLVLKKKCLRLVAGEWLHACMHAKKEQ